MARKLKLNSDTPTKKKRVVKKKVTPKNNRASLVYPDDFIGRVVCDHNVDALRDIPDDSIDLVVTSPPYDKLRSYDGYKFEFEELAAELYRVAAPGGIVVWVVADMVIKGSESGSSFRQALGFIDVGFNLHDTMIYRKVQASEVPSIGKRRYSQEFEYMFVLSKGTPRVFNPLFQPKKAVKEKDATVRVGQFRLENGEMGYYIHGQNTTHRLLSNIWTFKVGFASSKDKIAYEHPAIFPEQLALRHILSWTNPGDVVLDPFSGSGTTLKMAKLYRRKFIGVDVSEKYCKIARTRVQQAKKSRPTKKKQARVKK